MNPIAQCRFGSWSNCSSFHVLTWSTDWKHYFGEVAILKAKTRYKAMLLSMMPLDFGKWLNQRFNSIRWVQNVLDQNAGGKQVAFIAGIYKFRDTFEPEQFFSLLPITTNRKCKRNMLGSGYLNPNIKMSFRSVVELSVENISILHRFQKTVQCFVQVLLSFSYGWCLVARSLPFFRLLFFTDPLIGDISKWVGMGVMLMWGLGAVKAEKDTFYWSAAVYLPSDEVAMAGWEEASRTTQ